jgi:hypothetical protein
MTDRSAFDEFVHARQRPGPDGILLTGNHHTGEDLLQQALLQTARHWERISTSPRLRTPRDVPPEHLVVAQAPVHRDEPGGVRRKPPAADSDLRLTLDARSRS